MLSIIAIIGKNRELGKDNKLIWHIPDDMKRFRELTSGHPVIMGRKTFESIGRPLPNRTNIVITSDQSFTNKQVLVASSFEQALEKSKKCAGSDETFVIGGGQVYKEAIDKADRLYLTIVDASADADTFFPAFHNYARVIEQEKHSAHGLSYTYTILDRL